MNDKNNWKTIIISAVITGFITLLTTLAINYLSSKKSKLSYVTQTSIPFQKDSSNVRIYNLELLNEGEDIIENIKGQIKFKGQSITNYKLTNSPVLAIQDSLTIDSYQIQIASLNPAEKITMSFLIASSNQVDSLPKVDFRAKGLFANIKAAGETKEEELPLYKLLLFAISIAVALSSVLLAYIRKRFKFNQYDNNYDDEYHSDDQNKIIAYLCGIHGLTNELTRYLDQKTDVSYWSEADYFGNISLSHPQDPNNNKRLLVLLDLINYARVTKVSIGIICYNIAKIYKALGDSTKSDEYLEKAKLIIPKRINKRLSIDKLFFP